MRLLSHQDFLMNINIVLVAPQIPQNTGTIGRLCVCTDAKLHLIEPLGFSLDESRIKRAGLDYWSYLDLKVHKNWPSFLTKESPVRMMFASTKSKKTYFDYSFKEGDYIIFGNEGSGLPSEFYTKYHDSLYTIPMPGKHSRSHNLANSVSIVLYEAIRQLTYTV